MIRQINIVKAIKLDPKENYFLNNGQELFKAKKERTSDYLS
jgi:hypothetical protein